MHIDFTIPLWLIWTLGLVFGGFLLGAAAVGMLFMWSMRNFRIFG